MTVSLRIIEKESPLKLIARLLDLSAFIKRGAEPPPRNELQPIVVEALGDGEELARELEYLDKVVAEHVPVGVKAPVHCEEFLEVPELLGKLSGSRPRALHVRVLPSADGGERWCENDSKSELALVALSSVRKALEKRESLLGE